MKKKNNSKEDREFSEGNVVRKLQKLTPQNILSVTLPNEQTTKLGFKKGDYVKVTNDGKTKIIIEKLEL